MAKCEDRKTQDTFSLILYLEVGFVELFTMDPGSYHMSFWCFDSRAHESTEPCITMASSDWHYLSDDGQRKVCGAITLRIVDLVGHIEVVGIMRNIGVGNSSAHERGRHTSAYGLASSFPSHRCRLGRGTLTLPLAPIGRQYTPCQHSASSSRLKGSHDEVYPLAHNEVFSVILVD